MPRWAVPAIVVIAVGGLLLNQLDRSSTTPTFDDDSYPSSSSTYSVTYRVTGESRRADLTYENENGDTSQETGASVPWSHSFRARGGAFLYISAQKGGAPGDIHCSIEVNGQPVETNTSTGAFSICTASGTL